MQITSKYQFYKYAAMSSFAVFLLGGALMLQPLSFTDNSYADSSNTDISINIGETIMLPELSQEAINLNLEPNVDGDFTSASIDVRMSTNHVSGYTLTMSTEGTETALTSSDFDSYKIDALSSKTSATDFANLSSTASINKWGYATDNNGDSEGQTEANYYYGITNKDNPTTIKITDGPTNSSETNVTFATKGKDLAAGTYSNVVVFSAVGNIIPKTKEYMHELTASWCAEKAAFSISDVSGTTYEVIDARTNESYWIRKFGNLCWMVENLYLPAGTIINTDNNYSKIDFPAYPTTDSIDWANTAGAKIITGSRYRTTDSGNYDGTYMNWYTATAGTGGDSGTNKVATSDICPTNWRLSTHAENVTTSSVINNIGSFYADKSGATISPVLPGYYSIDLYGGGSAALWWSGTQNDADRAYNLNSDTSRLYTYDRGVKSGGGSIRCLLAGS